jgi:putative FmdB family regulatory protein
MPTYLYECEECGSEKEEVRSVGSRNERGFCDDCHGLTFVKFTPNANISIPGHFRMDRGWHLPPDGGTTSSSVDANSRVHSQKKTSFRERFDKEWKSRGGS